MKGRIIVATGMTKGGQGDLPFRFVIVERLQGKQVDYTTHMQVTKEDGTKYLCHGNYDMTLWQAMEDFIERVKRNNRLFKVGGVSWVDMYMSIENIPTCSIEDSWVEL